MRSSAHSLRDLVMTLASIGETSVALAMLALPREVASVLVDVDLAGRGLVIVRMMGVAVLALGITWWTAGRDAEHAALNSSGFVLYNVGIGTIFGWAALGASHPALPWIVCAVHLVAGVTFGVLDLVTRRQFA